MQSNKCTHQVRQNRGTKFRKSRVTQARHQDVTQKAMTTHILCDGGDEDPQAQKLQERVLCVYSPTSTAWWLTHAALPEKYFNFFNYSV